MNKISLIIADDHPVLRFGLSHYLSANDKYALLGVAKDGIEAMAMIRTTLPDMAILDIEMPGLTGLAVCQNIINEKIRTKVLFFTMYKDHAVFLNAVKKGASGFLSKECQFSEIDRAIAAISSGKFYSAIDEKKPLTQQVDIISSSRYINEKLQQLTNSEKRIFLLIARQKSTKEIAEQLSISESTVKNHRHNMINKLKIKNGQNSLLRFAIEYSKYF
jgi:two-component system, NarL family, response regulator DegU